MGFSQKRLAKIGFCYLCSLLLCNCAGTSEYHGLPLSTPSGLQFKKPVKTWQEIVRRNTIIQALDYSCGAASLATLMRYYFKDNVDEKTVLTTLIDILGVDTIKRGRPKGFSLLDLKKAAEHLGYQAVGVKLKISALSKLPSPVLVHLKLSDVEHFAVLRGVRGDRVFLADPARGNLRIPLTKFVQEWSGATLVLARKGSPLPVDYPLKIQEESLIRNELQVLRQQLHRR